jgi:hypothetical protein
MFVLSLCANAQQKKSVLTFTYQCTYEGETSPAYLIKVPNQKSVVGEFIRVSALRSNGLTRWTATFRAVAVENGTVQYKSLKGELVNIDTGKPIENEIDILWPKEDVPASFTDITPATDRKGKDTHIFLDGTCVVKE